MYRAVRVLPLGCRYADRSLSGGSAKNRPSAIDFSRQRPIEGEIDRRQSIYREIDRRRLIEGEKGKKRKRRKEDYLFPRAILAGASSLPAGRQRPRIVAARGSPALFLPREEKC
ncbi:hypothetical protein BHM03_00034123 [Ensete ventricosum]|nr:hypothetical protein BHM03_00034123 [Ensete ventricosum]